ncbi:MAG: DASS family sodium-coupled anion symporter [Vicinamibacterales bacterium]
MTRTLRETVEAAASLSPADEELNRRRHTAGFVLGPVAFAGVLLLPMGQLPGEAHRLAAVLVLVGIFWVTEAVPVAVTALLGPILAILLRVAPAQATLAPFADPIIFLFIGSFMLAEAAFVHGLDRRVALAALNSRVAGRSATRVFVVYSAVVAAVSMWVSNTAATAMMFPIGLSIVSRVAAARRADPAEVSRFALAMMLTTAFAATVGGLATPVGTPPNLIGMGMLERVAHIRISFLGWLAVGIPAMIALFVLLVAYFVTGRFTQLKLRAEDKEAIRSEFESLGPISVGERNVVLALALTVTLWLAPGIFSLVHMGETAFGRLYIEIMPEGVAAMVGALLLFLLPVEWRKRRFTLHWGEAARIDWGTALLYGGGLALGELAFATGLAEGAGRLMNGLLPVHSTFALTVVFTAGAILLSELTSNTAAAALIVPVAIAVALAAGVRPLEPALGATLGSSMGFVMPVSTPANAIVYSSGYIPIGQMVRHGLLLDAAGFLVIVTAVALFGQSVG